MEYWRRPIAKARERQSFTRKQPDFYSLLPILNPHGYIHGKLLYNTIVLGKENQCKNKECNNQ
jgi:hypothetical protein